MAEWHITPDYVINNWTDELLDLMIEKLTERKEREKQVAEGRGRSTPLVEPAELFAKAGNLAKVVNQP